MKWARLVVGIIALVVAVGFFVGTFVQFPTPNTATIAGQLFGSVVIGLIIYGFGWVIIRGIEKNW